MSTLSFRSLQPQTLGPGCNVNVLPADLCPISRWYLPVENPGPSDLATWAALEAGCFLVCSFLSGDRASVLVLEDLGSSVAARHPLKHVVGMSQVS